MFERLPKLEFCCCGCSLRTGTKIIGWFGLIGWLIIVLFSTGGLIFGASDNKDVDQDSRMFIMVASIILLVISVVATLIYLMLLIGAYQEKTSCVKAYLIISAIGIVITIIRLLFGTFSTHGQGGQAIIQSLVTLALSIYFFLVVNSYYFTMPGVQTGVTYA